MLTSQQIERYAQRRGQAMILSEPRAVAAKVTALGHSPVKLLRCTNGRETRVAILYTPPVAVRAG